MKIKTLLKKIAKVIPAHHTYAHSLLSGHSEWSGSDLAAGARKWSSYRNTRSSVIDKVTNAGGTFIATESNGRILAAVSIGQDDYGNEIFDTECGVKVMKTKMRAYKLGLAN